MESNVVGFLFLAGYVVLVGVASFLQKYTMETLTPYQINFLMAIGMAVTAIPALLIAQGNFRVPIKALPLGAPIGLMMALGSISYVLALSRLDVGTAAALSTSYVVVVAVLSRVFLAEKMSALKLGGIALTLIGVAMLSWQEQA
ncbi:MAG TPA: DMT family transporter [Actinomycetota bacterium]|nr:DMT family transporter [Actinomycetota bacterium]